MTLTEYIDILKDLEAQGYGDTDVAIWRYSKESQAQHIDHLEEDELKYSEQDCLIIVND